MSAIGVAALRSRLGTAVAVVALAVGGCSGDEVDAADRPSPRPSAGGSPSGSPGATTDSGPPDVPAARDTAASRKGFARVVVDSWSHALQTNRATSVTRLSKGRPCQGCAELRGELTKRKREGWHVDFPGAEVGRTEVRRGAGPGTWVVRTEVDIPASRSYFDDGAFRNDNEAHEGGTFEVTMRKDGRRWTLLGFRVRT